MTFSVLAPSWRKTGMYTCFRPSTRTMLVWMNASSRGVATSRTNAALPCSARSGMSPMRSTRSYIEFESIA